jgi:hypothetical protein
MTATERNRIMFTQLKGIEEMREQLKSAIIEVINVAQGIKGVSLSIKVIDKILPAQFDTKEYFEVLESLVKTGKVVEIEYELSDGLNRIKTFYLPENTGIVINKN